MPQRIARGAGVAGLLAALLLSVLPSVWMTPLILQAEIYEVQTNAPLTAEPPRHGAEAWSPADGRLRTLSTFGGNRLVAVGFGLPPLPGAPQPVAHASLTPDALLAVRVSNLPLWLVPGWLFRRQAVQG